MKKINPSSPSFEKLITNNNVYVDKTSYLQDLITSGGDYFFCSRPRRFGKTLAINTLEAIFKGRRELFKGLAIDATDYDWKEYPVIHIDFGLCAAETAEELAKWLNTVMGNIAEDYSVNISLSSPYYTTLNDLIKALAIKAPVVILFDEYDKILSSNIYNPEVEKMRDVIRGFFEVIKASYNYVRFVFITGVTQYAKVSIFSSMNNLNDISLDERFACMFGYTQEELESYFANYIDEGIQATGMDKASYLAKLKQQYDGYRFAPNAETVYNPVSIGLFFSKGANSFQNYWVDTGNMKLLMDVAKKVNFNIASTLDSPLSRFDLSNFDIVSMSNANISAGQLKALLLQAGYLTITKTEDDEQTLYLDYPNTEVRTGFVSNIVNIYTGTDSSINCMPSQLISAFRNGDTGKAITIIKSIYASVPYNLETAKVEANYHAMFHCIMKAAGADLNSEVATNMDRIDSVLKLADHIYVIEFKKDESITKAMNQIKKKNYMQQYEAWKQENPSRMIHLVGISFSTQTRNIAKWKEIIL